MFIIRYQDTTTGEITEANVFNHKEVFTALCEHHGDYLTFWQRYTVLDGLVGGYISERLNFQEKIYIHQNPDQFQYNCDVVDLIGKKLLQAVALHHDIEWIFNRWAYHYVNSDAMMQTEFNSVEEVALAAAQYIVEQLSKELS